MAERKEDRATTGKAHPQPTESPVEKSGRKPWVKKTPVEVVLEQIGKQEAKVNEMREELKKEERELQKLQQAKKVLETA